MRLAFDASIQHAGRPTGVERAQATLLAALARAVAAGAPHELHLLTPTPDRPLPAGLSDLPRSGASRLPLPMWRARVVPAVLADLGCALLHAPVVAMPRRAPCPVIVTVHELPRADDDPDARALTRRRHGRATAIAARHAARLACVSARTRDALLERHPEAAPRAVVLPNAVDPRFTPLDAPRDDPFVLAVGRLRAKKNHAALLDAFSRVAPLHPGLRLVVAGPSGPAAATLRALAARPELLGRVDLPGFVDDEVLLDLYRRATLVVLPSRAEGFGLPALEAMACGAPVLCDPAALAAEAIGDAALPFALHAPPDAPASLACRLAAILDDPAARADAAARGRRHAATRSADAAARAALDLYAEVAA